MRPESPSFPLAGPVSPSFFIPCIMGLCPPLSLSQFFPTSSPHLQSFCLCILSIVEGHRRHLAWSLQLQRVTSSEIAPLCFWTNTFSRRVHKKLGSRRKGKWLCPVYSLFLSLTLCTCIIYSGKENVNVFSKLFLKIASYYSLLCLFPHIT